MRKIKISDKQLTQYIAEAVDERGIINEATETIDKSDIKAIIKKEVKDFLVNSNSSDLEKKIERMVAEAVKTNKDVEKHIVEITRNVMVQVYKNLWTRRSFWASDLKNSSN